MVYLNPGLMVCPEVVLLCPFLVCVVHIAQFVVNYVDNTSNRAVFAALLCPWLPLSMSFPSVSGYLAVPF